MFCPVMCAEREGRKGGGACCGGHSQGHVAPNEAWARHRASHQSNEQACALRQVRNVRKKGGGGNLVETTKTSGHFGKGCRRNMQLKKPLKYFWRYGCKLIRKCNAEDQPGLHFLLNYYNMKPLGSRLALSFSLKLTQLMSTWIY